ncbi:MAG: HEAT repeat domain-containing protein [Gemmatimonadaceae bacterium]
MDRHVEFTTQLAHLVALYARDKVDTAAEKAALRSARGAAKHGALDVSVVEGTLRAGLHDANTDQPEVAALQALLTTLGIARIRVRHHAKQEEVKRFAKLLGAVAAGRKSPEAFAGDVAAREWMELEITRVPDAVTSKGSGAEPVAEPAAAAATEPAEEPVAENVAEPATVEAAATEAPTPAAELPAVISEEPPAESEEEAPPEVPTKPLAEQLPAAAEALLGPEHRELFERLITASTPSTLRRLLDPVQAAIEQAAREGSIAVSVRLLLAMFACEACAEDDEMRRQFVVTLRRLTKPTLTRAYAMRYAETPDGDAEVEQALARFGEDGAEAVADRIGSAPTRALRARYTELLSRLPGTNDALLAMLDDQRESVVERAIELIVALRHPDMERVLGEQLSKESTRVRQAATRGLAAATDSAFAADALLRAVQDAAPEVRLTAAVGLQSRREERLTPSLVRRVDDEEELDVQLALVSTLGRLAAPEGVQKLIALANPTERLLRRPNMPVIRLSAIEAMGEARTPAAMVALQKLLEDKEKEVRETAARLYSRARRQTTASAGIPVVIDP